MNEIFTTYALEILKAIVLMIAGYVGIAIKNLVAKYITTESAKKVADTTVKYVEQIYTDIHGKEKLKKALVLASDILETKNIVITEQELYTLLEAAVKEMNDKAKAA